VLAATVFSGYSAAPKQRFAHVDDVMRAGNLMGGEPFFMLDRNDPHDHIGTDFLLYTRRTVRSIDAAELAGKMTGTGSFFLAVRAAQTNDVHLGVEGLRYVASFRDGGKYSLQLYHWDAEREAVPDGSNVGRLPRTAGDQGGEGGP